MTTGFTYMLALKSLAMEPEAQCQAEGDYNVAQELQYEISLGRCLIEKGRLDSVEEKSIAALADSVQSLPDSALVFANGHAPNVAVMKHPAWAPLRDAASGWARAAAASTSTARRHR